MSTQTITEFLDARIAEDEAVARRVADGPGEPGGRGIWSVAIGVSGNDAKFAHVASDPARALAECAAKRAIISNVGPYSCSQAHPQFDVYHPDGHLSPVIRALAAVFKDHADYQEDWAL